MAAHEYYNVNQFISQSAVSNGTATESLENDQNGFMSKPAVKITQVVLKELIFYPIRPILVHYRPNLGQNSKTSAIHDKR